MAELMKGKVWAEHKHKLSYPVIAEVKYDEIRLHVKLQQTGVQFLSYAGKPLHNLSMYSDMFWEYLSKANLTELDCGIEVNGNFNDSYRWVRSSKGIPENLMDASVRFILFDLPNHTDVPFSERSKLRDLAARAMREVFGLAITVPEAFVGIDEAHVDRLFLAVRERRYEGLMVKSLSHLYQPGKRIDGWLKMKPEETFDGRITGINQAFALDGTPHSRAGSVDVVLEDGSTASPAGIEWSLARAMWENPEQYIGEWCEFKAMERDRQGGYRHPSFVRLRERKV